MEERQCIWAMWYTTASTSPAAQAQQQQHKNPLLVIYLLSGQKANIRFKASTLSVDSSKSQGTQKIIDPTFQSLNSVKTWRLHAFNQAQNTSKYAHRKIYYTHKAVHVCMHACMQGEHTYSDMPSSGATYCIQPHSKTHFCIPRD